MKAIVHYPETKNGMDDLALKVATVHAEAITAGINKLSCSANEKRRLFDAIITVHQELAESAQKNTI